MVLARERIYVLLSAPALNSIPYYSWLRKYFPVYTLLNSSPITGMSVFYFSLRYTQNCVHIWSPLRDEGSKSNGEEYIVDR